MSGDPYDFLPPERARAIRAWLAEPLTACRLCGRPVYRTESRQRDPAESDEEILALVHLACLRAEEGG
ncbi:MAG: hypothetical protein ACTHM1_12060 [Solirubrobacteraceae bacterium]